MTTRRGSFGLSGTTTAANPLISFSVDQERTCATRQNIHSAYREHSSKTRGNLIRPIRNISAQTQGVLRPQSAIGSCFARAHSPEFIFGLSGTPALQASQSFSVYPEHHAHTPQTIYSVYQVQFRQIGNGVLVYPVRIIGLSGTIPRTIGNRANRLSRSQSQSPIS